MYKTNFSLVERCRDLRSKGLTLGKIVKAVKLSKTTVYDHIYDIALPLEVKERIRREAIGRLTEFNRKRKGKCMFGRVVLKPKGWSPDLIFLTAHFIFDGEVQTHSCIYHNRNKALINQVSYLMRKIFNLLPYNWLNEETGVHRISYHYVELADYMRNKVRELKGYITNASLVEKKIFLKAFFDDEGGVQFNKNLVKGFQYNLEILKLVHDLLEDFNIRSKVNGKHNEIIISRKPNLIKFRNEINFSKGIFINPNRKNSIWKKKLEKRKILDFLIDSYER